MAGVTLDAMIGRADFAQQTESSDSKNLTAIEVSHLDSNPLVKLLRKPDFQRETNQWSPEQIATFISSFANGELIPSLIFWKSESLVFVIDGGHRLSALRAWILDDYGDGPLSAEFYQNEIPQAQKKNARRARKLVEQKVGRYAALKQYALDSSAAKPETEQQKTITTIFSRGIDVQWIQGDQEVAEVSFFKINSQGTPLHRIESLLLKHRRKSYSIAARSIVRAGTGHKYWKSFDTPVQSSIEELSTSIFKLLFEPESTGSLPTLDLAIGGNASSFDALQMLLEIFQIVENQDSLAKAMSALSDDLDGTETVALLKRVKKVVERITGKDSSSLGLHPALYFYNHLGKHSRFLFLGVFTAFANAVRLNNKSFFHDFSKQRKIIEDTLISRKSGINQALANIGSSVRITKVTDLITGLVKTLKEGKEINDDVLLELLGLTGKFSDLKVLGGPSEFSKETKSAANVKRLIHTAPNCPICKGLLDIVKGANSDHIIRKQDGGTGTLDNHQYTHPFCNSGIKN